MNALHLHLAINHSPLYATLFAIAFVLIGGITRKRTLSTAGLMVAVVAALCGIAADLSGDQAADVIDHGPPIAGVEKTAVGPHDDAAGWFVTSSCITGGLAIVVLFVGRKKPVRPMWMEMVVAAALVFSLLIVVRVALLGGRIHHPEVRAVVGR